MTSHTTQAAIAFAVLLPALLVAHTVADHWVQTHHQAMTKGQHGWPGRMACAAHVGTYTLVTSGTVALLWAILDLPIGPAGFALGQVVSAVTHYWADRRSTLAALARRLGKGAFYGLGVPRAGRNDNPSLGTGAYALDQSWHWLWLFVAALLTVVI